MTRDTRTGRVLEKMVTHSLEHGGYKLLEQKTVGQRLGGGKHNVDIVAIVQSLSDLAEQWA